MRCTASTASALVASLLVKDVLASVHGLHREFHRKKRNEITVTDEVIETMTETFYVTVEWPSGQTVGDTIPDVATTSSTSVMVTTSSTTPAAPTSTSTMAAAVLSSSPAAVGDIVADPSDGGVFVMKPVPSTSTSTSTTTTPAPVAAPVTTQAPAQVPTTMAIVVVPAATTSVAAIKAVVNTGSSSGSYVGGKKRGLAYNDPTLTNGFAGGNSQVSWCYNWGQTNDGCNSAFEFIPILWGNRDSMTQTFAANAQKAIDAGSSHIFGFNEPDFTDPKVAANIPDPNKAASDHIKYIDSVFAGKGIQIGAPAVTNGASSNGKLMGLDYMEAFLNACKGCQIDFVNLHWYDSSTNFQYFKNHITEAHTRSGKTVWITEFAASGTQAEQEAFLQVVIPWLDTQPFVGRYAYFMTKDGVLVSGKTPNALGNTFMSYTSSIISPLIAR